MICGCKVWNHCSHFVNTRDTLLEDKANNMEGRTENWEETRSLMTVLSPEDYLASGLFIHVSQRATPTPTFITFRTDSDF